MCGIFGISNHKEAVRLAYLGLYALQHRGEESAGIVVHHGKKINQHRGMGLVGDVFTERDIRGLRGDIAVGHVRYSTTGSSNPKNIQPFLVKHKKGHIGIAHNGNLVNTYQLRNELECKGSIFHTTMDSEIIAHFLARSQNDNIEENLVHSLRELEGAYSLVLMFNDLLIGARDPYGWRPLCLGKLGDSYVLASETCALDLIQAKYIRDIDPGEVVIIDKDEIKSINISTRSLFPTARHAFCIFEYVYFARPDSSIFGYNVYSARKNLGRELARKYPAKSDLVMPIPDSGNSAALGFSEESGIPYETGMIRNHYIGRTFIQPSQIIRDFRVKVKLNPIKEVLRDKNVVIIEDSIVRGTTSRIRVKTIREAGAKKVHMRVSCPPLRHPCFYGIDFPTKKELIASKREIKWIKNFIGVDSLEYLSLEGMLKAMPLPKERFCTACFSGNYPTKLPKKLGKAILE